MKAKELLGKHRIMTDVELTEDCVKRIVQLLLVDWKFAGQSTDRKGLVFGRHDEVAFLSLDGDVTVEVVQPYEVVETAVGPDEIQT